MIYNFLAFAVYILIFPFILILSCKKKYRESLPARFFLLKNLKGNQSDVHFHACSFGEVNTIVSLAKNFNNTFITTITKTGFDLAKKNNFVTKFLPFELFIPFWLKKSKVLVIFEAELWLNLVKYAKKNGTYVVLLNARISDRSYKRYLKFAFYYKMIFKNIDIVYAQSKKDADRLKELGAKNVVIFGNVKNFLPQLPNKKYNKFKDKFFIVIASSHNGEEEMILNNLEFKENYKILLAPRHPERFEKVDIIFKNYAKKNNLSYEKFSQNLDLSSDCILLDTLGEVINFYAICDVCILCGSFIEGIGGHNPIEIAQFNKPIISGKFFHNQETLYSNVEGINIIDESQIQKTLDSKLCKTFVKQNDKMQDLLKTIKDKI